MKVRIGRVEYQLGSHTEDGAALKRDNPDWRIAEIEAKTGVMVRHVSGPNETAVDLACAAAERLFETSIDKEEMDFLLLVTQSPDYLLPTSACIVQDRLKLPTRCMAFDINLGCSGFIYALAVGGALLESGLAGKGLIICSETYTKLIDSADRTCRPLFSDGAAAVILHADAAGELGPFVMGTDGSGYQSLIVPMSGARPPGSAAEKRQLHMNGAEVFMFTMDKAPNCVMALLEKAGRKPSEIDLFVFHQASRLVLENIIRRLDLPAEKVFMNFQNVGNTVSASIPIALKDAVDQGRLFPGQLVMLVGFGVGYSWGGCLVRWGGAQ